MSTTDPMDPGTDPGKFHATSARDRQADAAEAGYGTPIEAYNLAAAQVQATLALVEEKRTGNLIALLGARFASGQQILTASEETAVSRAVTARLGYPSDGDQA